MNRQAYQRAHTGTDPISHVQHVIVILAGLCIALCASLAPAQAFPAGEHVPGEILVAFRAGVAEDVRQQVFAAARAREIWKSGTGHFRVARLQGASIRDALQVLSQRPEVVRAEPNYIVRAWGAPDDPFYSLQWHLHMINIEEAWDFSAGEAVVIAVVDTGVRIDGEDGFGNRVRTGYNAFIKARAGWEDNNFHGTHVAGTLAQETGNGIGAAGIAFEAEILPVKVLNRSGIGSVASVVEGIIWAADNGADIINLSLGSTMPSWFLEQAADYAYGKGVTLVAASGNQGADTVGYPAAYDTTIAVGAVDRDGRRALFSNFGPELDVVAPGDGVFQETFDPFDRRIVLGAGWPRWQYSWDIVPLKGTSMATPHVAGVAALVKALRPDWGPDEIKAALVQAARSPFGAGRDDEYGYGIIDAAEAVRHAMEY